MVGKKDCNEEKKPYLILSGEIALFTFECFWTTRLGAHRLVTREIIWRILQ